MKGQAAAEDANRGGKQKMQRGYAELFTKTTRTKD